MKILMAVDGSAHSKQAIAYVKTHLNFFGKDTTITVVNVQMALPVHVAGRFSKTNIQSYYQDAYEKEMKGIRRALKSAGLEFTEVLKVGVPGDEIADLAKRDKFDMVVMGSHGRSLFRNLVLGSVATKVLAACSVPVLIIR